MSQVARMLRERAQEFKSQTQASGGPEDEGVKLSTIRRGPLEELRFRLREYQGRSFLEIRLWTRREEDGDWWPSKKGITFKPRELPELAEGMALALEELQKPSGKSDGNGPRSNL